MRPIYETAVVWPKGGTVIIHPALPAATSRGAGASLSSYAFSTAWSGTRPTVR